MPYPKFMDYKIAIARGITNPTTTCIHKFGHNPAMSTTFDTIWGGLGVYPFPLTATVVRIVSNTTTDATAGTGALTVMVEGLDSNWDRATETVTMAGKVAVTMSTSFKRIYRAKVLTAGNSATNDGNIVIFDNAGTITVATGVPTASTDVFAVIEPEKAQTLMAVYTVPNGFTGYMMDYQVTGEQGSNVQFQLMTRKNNAVFNIKDIGHISGNSLHHVNSIPEKFSATTDFQFQAKSSASGAQVSASFEVLLVQEVE